VIVHLMGENNPYGSDPYFALYPEPEHSAGGRLCRLILGMREAAYLREFSRVNLLQRPKWSAPLARAAAAAFVASLGPHDAVILLGRKVHEAFHGKAPWVPFAQVGGFLSLPHPSGLCRIWNEPGAIEKTRAAVKAIAPHLAPLIGAV
jgi:hypothetical protein